MTTERAHQGLDWPVVLLWSPAAFAAALAERAKAPESTADDDEQEAA